MAINDFMWDSVNGDRIYGSQDVAKAFQTLVSNGVKSLYDFQINPYINPTYISGGTAWINGRKHETTENSPVEIPTHPTEIDNNSLVMDSAIVLISNYDSREFLVEVKTDYPGRAGFAENEIPLYLFAYRSNLDLEKRTKRVAPIYGAPNWPIVDGDSSDNGRYGYALFPNGTIIAVIGKSINSPEDFRDPPQLNSDWSMEGWVRLMFPFKIQYSCIFAVAQGQNVVWYGEPIGERTYKSVVLNLKVSRQAQAYAEIRVFLIGKVDE